LKKNVIVICIDGCRLDRAYNSSVFKDYLPGTVFFSQSITYAPYTNSSLHAIFSGSYGNRNGCYSYWHSFKFKHEEFKTLTKYLHEEDYFTMADIHSRLAIPLNNFDEYHVYDESSVNLIDRHQNLIKMMKKKFDSGKKFFLYLHYEKIHTGIMKSVLKTFTNYSKEYFEKKKTNEERYDKLFHEAENYLQKMLDEVKFQDLLKDTLILIISDHGISVGEKFGERAYGAFCYDYTIRTFGTLISSDFSSKEITQQVRHVDFLPTILEYFELPIDENFKELDGQSLIPLILGKNIPEKIAYTETANPLNEKAPPKKPNTKSVRTSKWKLIFNEYNDTKELYDIENDPKEENNLIGNSLVIENELWDELKKLDVVNS